MTIISYSCGTTDWQEVFQLCYCNMNEQCLIYPKLPTDDKISIMYMSKVIYSHNVTYHEEELTN